MCGIAGVVALNGRDPEPGTAGRMRDAIVHRGPDGNGEYEGPGVGLAACRLAIVDLAPRGVMPMSTPDGRFHIVHNGEIYNRLDLRSELEARGVQLRTTTDTEVILQLYALEGERMLDRLDGMFAFAIWDSGKRELFAARDRVGEKPFHWAEHEGRLYFGSEPKALFAAGVPRQFDESTWLELLIFRATAGAPTPYVGVKRLPHGHWLRANRDGVRVEQWWRFPEDGQVGDPAEIKQMLEDSVRRRLIADVPVGTLLSGGLDSSTVTTVAAGQSPTQLRSFTVRDDTPSVDEWKWASETAQHLGVEHHEIRVLPEERAPSLIETTWLHDEPMALSPAGELLKVTRYARQYVRVLLTGESADELFGGYGRLRMYRYPRLVRAFGRLMRPIDGQLRMGSRAHRMIAASRLSDADWVPLTYAEAEPLSLVKAPMTEWATERARIAESALARGLSPILAAVAYERETHLPAVLTHTDRMTMGAPVECRMPFTDHRILALSAHSTARDLFKGANGKQLIRDAMAGRLPQHIVDRPKQGWQSPWGTYLRTNPVLRDWLSKVPDHEIVARSPLGRDGARTRVDAFLAGDRERGRHAWMLGRIVLWHQVCVERIDPFGSPSP